MKAPRRHPLPPAALLRTYAAAGPPDAQGLDALPCLGRRFRAVREARAGILSETFLDCASESEFQETLLRFYEACVPFSLHLERARRRAGTVRHALGHLLRCPDPLPRKAARCLAVDGAYRVSGLGPAFWSALFQALDPERHPSWLPGVVAGLRRLGLLRGLSSSDPEAAYGSIQSAYHRLRGLAPQLTAQHVDHFLVLVSGMRGRNLGSAADRLDAGPDIQVLVRQERGRVPLRQRLKARGKVLKDAGHQLEAALAAEDGSRLLAALAAADPDGAARCRIDGAARSEALTLWVGRLWEADEPLAMLAAFYEADPLPGAGPWLPPAVLHLRDARRFQPWNDACRAGHSVFDDAATSNGATAERYVLYNEAVAALCAANRVHPLEAPAIVAAVSGLEPEAAASDDFGGFCLDTFRFLNELAANNHRAWMDGQRDRYRFVVREPLVELCQALAARYVEPVLRDGHGWDLEVAPRSGKALTSICRNDYGQSLPYHAALWITFHRRAGGDAPAGRRGAAQFFVRLDAAGLRYGLRLGRDAREACRLFRRHVQEHGEALFDSLRQAGALSECRFTDDDQTLPPTSLVSAADLRTWAAGKSLVACKALAAEDPLLASDALVGDILLTFDRLLPAYACAVEADPLPVLRRRSGGVDGRVHYAEADFRRATYLPDEWLDRTRSLLHLKPQLILQGVPGTGKTHVARNLARLLTGGREEAVRLVQFHPSYSYEEFVEGIKVKSVEVGGRHEVTYPVEEGLLCGFASEAARRPALPHVLIIDEINRGNLPRVFGELLYLLEYRDQAIELPYSRRGFRLPANLILVGTMNAADRSVALLDQALRRRFSFVDMQPDGALLAAWLKTHPPAAGPSFAETVVGLFERLNARLRADLSPRHQLGHSYFMAPDLDLDRLRVVWEHHVRPLLEEAFAGQPERVAAYELDRLLSGDDAPPSASRRRAGAGRG